MGMKEHADDFARRRAHAAQMGGDEAVAGSTRPAS